VGGAAGVSGDLADADARASQQSMPVAMVIDQVAHQPE
jgi:hypothetical protein